MQALGRNKQDIGRINRVSEQDCLKDVECVLAYFGIRCDERKVGIKPSSLFVIVARADLRDVLYLVIVFSSDKTKL